MALGEVGVSVRSVGVWVLRRVAWLPGVVAAAVLVSLVPGMPALAEPPAGGVASAPVGDRSVPVSSRAGKAAAKPAVAPDAVSAAWPQAGTAVVQLAAGPNAGGYLAGEDTVVAGSGSPGGLPVTVRSVDEQGSSVVPGVGAAASSVRLSVWDRAATEVAGIKGVVLQVARADGVPTATQVGLRVDYSAFAHGYGGDFGARLRLVALPGCVVSTPQVTACQTQTPVPSTNDAVARTVSAPVVAVPSGSARGTASAQDDGGTDGVVLALASTSGSDRGNYGATSLSPTYTWVAGSQGGDFSTSYPIRVPPAPSALVPDVAMRYSSGSVDGRVATTNNQPSWVGEGWDLQVGYVEAHHRSCRDDGHAVDDLCLDGMVEFSLVFQGRSSLLIRDDSQGWWHTQDDDGLRLEPRSGAVNGLQDSLYWVVFTQDGTRYEFGTDDNSAQGVIVFGDDAGESCHTGVVTSSYCTLGYRWNLRKVTDPRGNTIDYLWSGQGNQVQQKYGRWGNQATVSLYDREAVLAAIEYGGNAVTGTGHTSRVTFDVGWRCTEDPCMGGTETRVRWYDTPWDLYCEYAATSCPGVLSPAFYSWYRLIAIHTQVKNSGGAWAEVDRWSMSHVWPGTGDGTSMALWFYQIIHTGHVDSPATPPQGSWTAYGPGAKLANRVYIAGSETPMWKRRMDLIVSDTGAETAITYAAPECTPTTLPSEHDNSKRCFPVHWNNGANAWNWFHKYVVMSVTERGAATGDTDETWTYQYSHPATRTNSTVMWAWDEGPNTPDTRKSWTQWRGYTQTDTIHGPAGGPRTLQAKVFQRGLHGNPANRSGGARTVTINAETTGILDYKYFQGWLREELTVDLVDGVWKAQTHHVPMPAQTAYRAAGSGQAYIVREGSTRTAALKRDNTWRTSVVNTTYDFSENPGEDARYGLPVKVDDLGDNAITGDETCTRTKYAQHVTVWKLDYPYENGTTDCAGTPTTLAGVRTFYDGPDIPGDGSTTLGAAPTRGLVTRTEALNGPAAGPHTWVKTSTATHDAHGRITRAGDALNRYTTTAYTPAAGGPVTAATVTNPAGHIATTNLDRHRGTPDSVVDPNNKTTSLAYDPLGQLTKVWLPGRATTAAANIEYGYQRRTTGGNVITTKTLGPNGNEIVSHAIFDARLRPRQTQSTAPDGKRVIADTVYNNRGLVVESSTFYNNASEPTGTLLTFDHNAIDTQKRYVFDSLGRQTQDMLFSLGIEKWRTSTSHWADQVFVDQPAGGTDTTTYVDAHGRTETLRQHTGASSHVNTIYTYDRLDQLVKVADGSGSTDPTRNKWTYAYDLLGRKTNTTDPDAGASTMTYDNAGQLLTSTNARPVTLAYRYDSLGRTTGVFKDSVSTGTLLSESVFDTVAKGQLTSSTRWTGGHAYTTRVTAYDDGYRPLQTKAEIPTAETGLAGTHTFDSTYNVGGSIATQTLPAAGGLTAETLTFEYNNSGLVTRMLGAETYINATNHLWDGQPYERIYGASPKQVRQRFTFDEATRRLTATHLDTENQSVAGTYDSKATTEYSYDPAGNVQVIAGKTNGVRDQVECFNYDTLRRLTEAWTEPFWTCTTPQRGGTVDPYRLSWTHDITGNRSTQTSYHPSGDTVSTYTHPAPGAAKPHTVSQVTRTGPGAGTDNYTYDAAGNTLTRPGPTGAAQTLTWDDVGKLSTVTEASQTTTYLYAADGNRLITRDPTGKTLYLPAGTEVRYTTATATSSATRYYGGAAVRTTTGGLNWLASDHHGTNTHTVNPSTLSVQQRRSLPYGAPRGTPPAGWPGDKGFVGGTQDPTGLTHLGAREYDPQLGRFISLDPIIDYKDPQQIHGYAYGNNNPSTMSDPNGLKTTAECGPDGIHCPGSGGGFDPCAPNGCQPTPAPGGGEGGKGKGKDPAVVAAEEAAERDKQKLIAAAKALFKIAMDELGITDAIDCFTSGDLGACIETGLNIATAFFGGLVAKLARKYGAPWQWKKAVELGSRIKNLIGDLIGGVRSWVKNSKLARRLADECNSFVPGTAVLLADGTTKPIEDIDIGDVVLATDPETKQTSPKPVIALIVGDGSKDLVQININPTRDRQDGTPAIIATAGHPFWVPELRDWIDATDLRTGQWLQTSAGTRVQITALQRWSQAATVHNLTIADIHTYHVLAANTPVLVHNSGPCDPATPTGSKGNPLLTRTPNQPGTINGRDYTGHALDRMQQQGIMPSVVENATRGPAIPGKVSGTTAYYDSANNITVIADSASGRVVTVDYGKIRQ